MLTVGVLLEGDGFIVPMRTAAIAPTSASSAA